ncbi:MAG: T9SS type A sorting domain-containing protein [Saprospiraceae bacterium]|nr:T9SS type A sorting domain-containing protein [Saprospiraceae bacterium]
MKKLLLFTSLFLLVYNIQSQTLDVKLEKIGDLSFPFVWALAMDPDSNLYVGNDVGKLWTKHIKDTIWTEVTSLKVTNNVPIKGVSAFSKNDIWVCTYGQGLYNFDGTTWKNYTVTNAGLPTNDYYRKVIKDYDSNYWFAISPGGLLKRGKDGTWTHYNTTNSPQTFANINSLILSKDSSIWASSSEKIFNIKKGVWTTYNLEKLFNYFPNGTNYLYEDQNGVLWVCADYGLFTFDKLKWTDRSDISDKKEISLISIDKSGSIWLLEYLKGLIRWNNGEKLSFYANSSNNIPSQAWSIMVTSDNKKLMLGNRGANLIIINDEKIPTSAKDIQTENISLFPNPNSTDILYFNLKETGEINIYNSVGQKVLTQKIESIGNQTISVEKLELGTYFVQMVGKEKIYIGKIIKE